MDWKSKEKRELIRGILAIKTSDEAERFLRDLMTEKEIEEFSMRFKAAKMLIDKVPYLQIENETGLSSTTIARVSKWLNGKEGGYRLILERLNNE